MKKLTAVFSVLIMLLALCSCEKEAKTSFFIVLNNKCNGEVYGVNMKITAGEKEINKFIANGDRAILDDEKIEFEITEEDLKDTDAGEIECYITVLSQKNSYRECNKTLKIEYELGETYEYNLSGDHSIGFYLAKVS